MNTATNTTESVTFTFHEKSRANELSGAHDVVRTETVHADGRVEWSLRGESDGEWINQRGVRHAGRALDLATVTAARRSSGWTVRGV